MAAMMTVYGLLWAAGGNDIIAIAVPHEHQPDHLLHARRGLRRAGDRVHHHQALVHLAAASRQRELLHGYETGIIMRSPEGGYSERHLPISGDRGLRPHRP
jgi:ubiquinol-cytochrome c reductase cytochrome b subunit